MDIFSLANKLNTELQHQSRQIKVFIQVKTSDEECKRYDNKAK
jgi:uncharacterized pyridoxal phosphate-containing UPF0001 family protein